MNKVDLFNARNCSEKVEGGMEISVVDVGSFRDIDKDGHEVTVSVLKAEDGSIYCSISATIAKSLDDLTDIIADNGGKGVKVKVIESKSQNGRDFFQLKIIG